MSVPFPDFTYCVEKLRAEQKKVNRKVDSHFAEQYEDSMVNTTFLEDVCNITKDQYLKEFMWTSDKCRNASAVWEGASDDLGKILAFVQLQFLNGTYATMFTEDSFSLKPWSTVDLEAKRCFTFNLAAALGHWEGIANILISALEVGELFVHTPGLLLTRDIGLSHYAEETAKYVRSFSAKFPLFLHIFATFHRRNLC